MIKKSAIFILVFTLLLCSCSAQKNDNHIIVKKEECLKGVWISCYELDFGDKTKINFIKKINEMFSDIKSKGFNTIFVHVRSHCDAYYKSSYFPYSSFISKKQGVDPGYDPLEIMCYFSKIFNLKIHAWINPFRILTTKNINSLSENNPAKKLIINKSRMVRSASGGYYFNPAYKYVRELIVNGVKEIVQNYNVDGIHFDDYFYPTTDKSFDKYEYKKLAGSLSLYEWRRKNIDKLISKVYKTVHAENKIFGISPHCSLHYNYNTQYADIKKWCNSNNYIDYIAPQIYFGFKEKERTPDNQPLSFKECFKFWNKISKNKTLYIGLGLYRCGEKGEWSESNNIIARQIDYLKSENSKGYIIFSYSYFNQNKKETANAVKIINT